LFLARLFAGGENILTIGAYKAFACPVLLIHIATPILLAVIITKAMFRSYKKLSRHNLHHTRHPYQRYENGHNQTKTKVHISSSKSS
jgi:hypothetical protein